MSNTVALILLAAGIVLIGIEIVFRGLDYRELAVLFRLWQV